MNNLALSGCLLEANMPAVWGQMTWPSVVARLDNVGAPDRFEVKESTADKFVECHSL
jgi:hypothetical protein